MPFNHQFYMNIHIAVLFVAKYITLQKKYQIDNIKNSDERLQNEKKTNKTEQKEKTK